MDAIADVLHRRMEADAAIVIMGEDIHRLADAEIVDLRTLDRASLDWETIGASVRKTIMS